MGSVKVGMFLLLVTFGLSNASVYYVSPSGNNTGAGTYVDPWLNVNALNAREFQPGDRVFFKNGGTYIGACCLEGSGVSTNPIVIGSYMGDSGTNVHPVLTGKWDQPSVFELSEGNQYVVFKNLDIKNENTNNSSILNRFGVHVQPPVGAGEIAGLQFEKMRFFNIQGFASDDGEKSNDDHQSVGINMETVDDDTQPSWFSDVIVSNCIFTDIDGRGFSLVDKSCTLADRENDGSEYHPSTGVIFVENHGTNIWRNLAKISGARNVLVEWNEMYGTEEGSAFWNFATEGLLVQYNSFSNLRRGGGSDTYICHVGYNSSNSVFQYNYGCDVEGGLIEILCKNLQGSFQKDVVVRYNIGVDVGWDDRDNSAGILVAGNIDGAEIYNNTCIQLDQDREQLKAIVFGNWNAVEYPGLPDPWPSNVKVFNNIFYNEDASVESTFLRMDQMLQNGCEFSHNLYFGNVMPPKRWDGVAVDDVSFTCDPKFMSPGYLGDWAYKLKNISPVVGAGVYIEDNGGLDFYGNLVATNGVTLPTLGFHETAED